MSPEEIFRCHSFWAEGKFWCTVLGCDGRASTKWNLWKHFADQHPWHLVELPGEGILPWCKRCGMQTSPFALGQGHKETALCREGAAKQVQHQAAVDSMQALKVFSLISGEELKQVEAFKYLGRLVSFDDNDRRAVNANFSKARKCWRRLSNLLHTENASPWVCGMLYKAVVMAVMLHGSESWWVSGATLKGLEGFHYWAACQMARTNNPWQNVDGS